MADDEKDTDIGAAANPLASAPKPAQANPVVTVAEKAPGNVPEKIPEKVPEMGGPKGPEPTRFGDWERNGICVDF
ncbi:MAG: succinate dehydrogenase assembly factor 4 [Alphaproteobacteria bacterium]